MKVWYDFLITPLDHESRLLLMNLSVSLEIRKSAYFLLIVTPPSLIDPVLVFGGVMASTEQTIVAWVSRYLSGVNYSSALNQKLP